MDVLPDQLPWWAAGPAIGLCVVAMYGLVNAKLGVSGGWLQLMFLGTGSRVTEAWRIWFNGGLVAGALLARDLPRRSTAPSAMPSARPCSCRSCWPSVSRW